MGKHGRGSVGEQVMWGFFAGGQAVAAQGAADEQMRHYQPYRHAGVQALAELAAMQQRTYKRLSAFCVNCGAPQEPVVCSYCRTPGPGEAIRVECLYGFSSVRPDSVVGVK